jgi:hypothetical protein
MQSFVQYTPTEIVFGKDAELKTAAEVKKWGGSRVMIVYGGGSVVRSGLLKRIEDELDAESIPYIEFGGVQPNPRLAFAEEGVEKAKEFGADLILAVGGGSSIDTAKGIAHGVKNPELKLWDIWTQKVELTQSLPVGVVLTISAAGSETSDSAVLTNKETGQKVGLSTEFNRPKFAIMNPELTYTLPKYQLTCGIVDIMMHTLDRYFTHTKGNRMTDEIAEALLRTTVEAGRVAFENQEDYDAMSEIMWCGSLSHNGLTGLGAVTDFAPHQLGHELSAKYDVAHGASLSAIWGAWAEYVYPEEPERFQRYAQKVWGIQESDPVNAAKAGIAATVAYFKSLDMPVTLGDLKLGELTDEDCRILAENCSRKGARTIGGFKVMDTDDIYEVYKLANK